MDVSSGKIGGREREREKNSIEIIVILLTMILSFDVLHYNDWISFCFFRPMIIMNEIDFEECLKDSPAYRYVHQLEERASYLSLSPILSDTIISLQESTSTSNGSYRYVRRSLRTGLSFHGLTIHKKKRNFTVLQMSKSCNSAINSGKIFIQEFQYKSINLFFFIWWFSFRKFLKCIYDVGELFSSDDLTYKNLVKFSDYLREIQGLFSVNFLW